MFEHNGGDPVRICNRKFLYFAAFFVPVIMLAAVYLARGIFPFGDATVMTGDAQYQFVDYLSYLKTVVFGNNDLNYSFSKNLGGNMRGFSAYYYMSPLNFLTLLFPSEFLPVAQSFVLIVTVGLCSLSFCIMISVLYKPVYENLIFSISYAFMGFLAVYFQLSMYFTNLALFPLVVLGLFRLIEDNRHFMLYVCSLFLAVLSNYYSGFMICIFCLLVFIYAILLKAGNVSEIMQQKRTVVTFISSSLMAVLLSAFNLLPAVLSLQNEKNNFSVGLYRNFPVTQLFSKLYICSFKGNLSTGMPNIYCGSLMVLLCVLYFANRNIVRREKILSGIFIIFLVVNMYFNPFNVIWHGLNQPIGFPYRYSYMLSFLFIFLAYRGFVFMDRDKMLTKLGIFFGLFIAYSIFLIAAGNETTGFKEAGFTMVFLAAAALIIFVFSREKCAFKTMMTLLLIINAVDLSVNFSDAMDHLELASLTEYREYVSEMGKMISELKQQDETFYRIEKDVRRTHNDAMQFDYAGLSHFSSSEKKDKMVFLGKLGLRNNGNWAFYGEPSTMLLDCLMGVRHFVSQFHTIPNNYKKILIDDTYKGYLNDDALPLLFAGNKEIREVDYRECPDNPFAFQQLIADKLAGRATNIFKQAEITDYRTENLQESDENGYKHYIRTDTRKDGVVFYSVKVEDPMDNNEAPACLFAYFDAPHTQDVVVYRYDTDMGNYFGIYRWNIINMETHTEGDVYEISLHTKEDEMDVTDAYFYYEDRNAVRDFCNEIKKYQSELNKITSSHLNGSITIGNEDQCAVLSIPYDKAWRIKVDGQRAEPQPAAGMLLSFDVSPGKHEIDMRYVPNGVIAGIILSITALIAVVIASLVTYRSGRK